MVRIIFLSLVLFVSTSQAAFIVGVSTNSWQEKLPIVISAEESEQLTSFSSFGISLGFDYLFTTRVRYALAASFLPGKADIHKLNNARNPRRDFTSVWLTNKLHWRVTKTFSFGPSVVTNQRSMEGLSSTVSVGGFLDFDYDLYPDWRLTQALGSMSDSKQLAYSFILQKVF